MRPLLITSILFFTFFLIFACNAEGPCEEYDPTCSRIAEAIISVSPGATVNIGEEITFSATDSTFDELSWERDGTSICSGSDTCQQTIDEAGTYEVAVNVIVFSTGEATNIISQGAVSNEETIASTSVTITVEGNSEDFFTISDISGDTTEGGDQATFTIKLKSEPNGDVVIDVATSNSAEGTVSPSTLTFTTSNYTDNQTVTVTGVDDALEDGDISYTIQLTINSDSTTDTTGYASLDPNDVSVTNTDNDTDGGTGGGTALPKKIIKVSSTTDNGQKADEIPCGTGYSRLITTGVIKENIDYVNSNGTVVGTSDASGNLTIHTAISSGGETVWTGLINSQTVAVGGNCFKNNPWNENKNKASGAIGEAGTTGTAFNNGTRTCDMTFAIYCVED